MNKPHATCSPTARRGLLQPRAGAAGSLHGQSLVCNPRAGSAFTHALCHEALTPPTVTSKLYRHHHSY